MKPGRSNKVELKRYCPCPLLSHIPLTQLESKVFFPTQHNSALKKILNFESFEMGYILYAFF